MGMLPAACQVDPAVSSDSSTKRTVSVIPASGEVVENGGTDGTAADDGDLGACLAFSASPKQPGR